MPMGTTDQPNSNERMTPSPTATAAQRAQGVQTMQTPRFPGSDEHGRNPVPPRQEYPGQYHQGDMIPPPGWAGTTNVDEPYLPPDYDKVLVARCYPDADSFTELREMAYAAGREVLRMARESTRQQAEIAGQPDPHDLSVERALTRKPGQPNPGQPIEADPQPRPVSQQPNQPQQPGQPIPEPTPSPPYPPQDQDRERREREQREERERQQPGQQPQPGREASQGQDQDREREERDQREQREERERRERQERENRERENREREDRERREREQKRD
jgi:hypothetical protein